MSSDTSQSPNLQIYEVGFALAMLVLANFFLVVNRPTHLAVESNNSDKDVVLIWKRKEKLPSMYEMKKPHREVH